MAVLKEALELQRQRVTQAEAARGAYLLRVEGVADKCHELTRAKAEALAQLLECERNERAFRDELEARGIRTSSLPLRPVLEQPDPYGGRLTGWIRWARETAGAAVEGVKV